MCFHIYHYKLATMQKSNKLLLSLLLLLIGITILPAQNYRNRMKNGNGAYDIHAYNLAIPEYEAALLKKPNDTEAMSKLADCYRMLNRLEKAREYYARVAMHRGVDKEVILQNAKVLKGLGRYDEARQWFLLYARDGDAMIGNHYAQSCDFAQQLLDNPNDAYRVENELINTSSSDFGPAFLGDRQVVFSSARTNVQNSVSFDGKQGNQLFVANISQGGYLDSPNFLRYNAGPQERNEGPVSYTRDGRQVAFTRNNFVDGTRLIPEAGIETTIHLATVDQSGNWVDEKPFLHNGAGFQTGFPCFSPDGNALFFSAKRADSHGGFDIYVSYRTANSWTPPENLGAVINSPGDEMTPFFDGDMLFFASDYHHGLGGFDIFRGEQDESGRWARIYHLGTPVNSSRDDFGFIFDPFRSTGFFTSNRTEGGKGGEDLYNVKLAAENIVLEVRNSSDGTPVSNAIVDFSQCGEAIYETDNAGFFTFPAIQGLQCQVIVTKEGYMQTTVDISTIGPNPRKQFDVQLSRMEEAYIGRIINYSTRIPVQGVIVTATNRNTGNSLETETDVNGDYYLALSPQSSYILKYSARGFREVNFTVNTENGLDRSILGVIPLIPATEVGPSAPGVPSIGPSIPAQPNTGTFQQGFAVQVAAVKSPDLGPYSELNNFGQIYSKDVSGTHKIRVGVFSTREEALKALSAIRTRGYQDAFLVKEEGVTVGVSPNFQPPIPTPTQAVFSNGLYKIQLAAYRNPNYFNPDLVAGLGIIEERMKGDLTVKYVGGIPTLSDARRALSQARAAGFSTAFIVVEDNGILRKVN